MKTIKYTLKINVGTEDNPIYKEQEGVVICRPYSEENLAIAETEAFGAVTVEEDGVNPSITQETVIAAMREACAAAIISGVDVALSDGTSHHFSLTLEDQLNLINLQIMADAGAEQIPYHADGENCKYYSSEDFHTITQAAITWKLYQESYFNSLRGYILSLSTEDALQAVRYGMDIPEPFQTDVLRQMTGGM